MTCVHENKVVSREQLHFTCWTKSIGFVPAKDLINTYSLVPNYTLFNSEGGGLNVGHNVSLAVKGCYCAPAKR